MLGPVLQTTVMHVFRVSLMFSNTHWRRAGELLRHFPCGSSFQFVQQVSCCASLWHSPAMKMTLRASLGRCQSAIYPTWPLPTSYMLCDPAGGGHDGGQRAGVHDE